MIIDFQKIDAQFIEKFKGGNGILETYNFVDAQNKIMLSRLKPGSNSGYHRHEGNSEIVYILSGIGHYEYDDTQEPIKTGDVHYCPMGHAHAMYNDGEKDLVYLAIVPQH